MPFLGKNPTAGFASIVKDDLTPDGSTTAFTLSKQVANSNDIAVFVGNVRQEPTDAYSVSGTTLTMTAAPASGLNFYVLHIAGTVESSVIPADGTITNAKLQSSAVTDAKIASGITASKLTGTMPLASFPSGTIIQTQVHQETGLTYFAHPASAGDDILMLASNANDGTSHLSVNITPNFSTSKILISVRLFFEGSHSGHHEYLFDIYRDSTKLGQPRVGSRRGGISSAVLSHASDVNSTPETQFISFYDSPSTTSQITYATAFNHSSNSGNLSINKSNLDIDSIAYERGTSIIIAQEIAQ